MNYIVNALLPENLNSSTILQNIWRQDFDLKQPMIYKNIEEINMRELDNLINLKNNKKLQVQMESKKIKKKTISIYKRITNTFNKLMSKNCLFP